MRRVLLLGPDGRAVRRYLTVIPDDVWPSTTDGLGALWICGDLRSAIVFATPGAATCWPGIPEPSTPSTHRDPEFNSDVISTIAREAGAAAALEWF
ncbi:hypothetical protein ACFZBU_47225 [Embleya sp. NPDC008237]|uniref:hypothetical protein n=1 Tax=Embleya sp. NPDC008237 TaxID=3363978 RepID=UPI0036EEDAEF